MTRTEQPSRSRQPGLTIHEQACLAEHLDQQHMRPGTKSTPSTPRSRGAYADVIERQATASTASA